MLPVSSAEGGIAGEKERELVPLQYLCISTLFSKEGFWWCQGRKKKKRAASCIEGPCALAD